MSVAALRAAVSWLTTPLVPDAYLDVFDPLRSGSALRARVEAVRPEAAGAATLLLRPGRGWTGHRAGQYVALGVEVDGVRTWRTYSITSPPGATPIAVTVKAVPGGSVSQRLVHGTRPGEILQLGPAAGDFVLPAPDPGPVLFVTAGSGITPVVAMLRTLAARAARIDAVLVHSAPSAEEVIFGPELRKLAARVPGFRLHEHHTRSRPDARRLTCADLTVACPDWADRRAYACGPEGLLGELERYWRDAGRADRLLTERFRLAAPTALGVPPSAGHVRFARSRTAAAADGATPLLEVGERLGVTMPSGCRQGICHGCLAVLRSGRVRDLRDGREHGEPGDLVQTCVSAAAGPIELDL